MAEVVAWTLREFGAENVAVDEHVTLLLTGRQGFGGPSNSCLAAILILS